MTVRLLQVFIPGKWGAIFSERLITVPQVFLLTDHLRREIVRLGLSDYSRDDSFIRFRSSLRMRAQYLRQTSLEK